MTDFSIQIKNETLEYIDDTHTYLVDGVIVPSITKLLDQIFPRKYANVPPEVLRKAAERGTAIHEKIERLVKDGEFHPDIADFLELRDKEGFFTIASEIPVILHLDKPVAAGRIDLLLGNENGQGLADVKTTSKLDLAYLHTQLNLYRIAFEQCYDTQISFLAGIHLRNGAKYKEIPIDDSPLDLLEGLI